VDAAPRTIGPLESADEQALPDRGLLVLDASLKPIWANAEAVRILTYPDRTRAVLTAALANKFRSRLLHRPAPNPRSLAHISRSVTSGRRRYFCRVFVLDTFGTERAHGVLLERSTSWSAWMSKIATEFRLTPRERQAFALLGQGLTSREMADRMRISPNTVKAFMRVIMIKMGVSSRSSILGKVLTTQPSRR